MNDHGNHLDEDAELYALGMLAAERGAGIEAHLRGCAACAQRVGHAEAAVAALTQAGLRRTVRPPPPWAAVAAALLLALSTALLAAQNAGLRAAERDDRLILGSLVQSHFVHAQFTTPAGAPLPAKVVYEPHGRWYAVLALDAKPGWRVIVPARRPQAFALRDGVAAVRFVPDSPVAELDLVDGAGALVGSVRPSLKR